MRLRPRLLVRSLVAAGLAAACGVGAAQSLSTNYALTAPVPLLDPELSPRAPVLAAGPWRLAAAASTTGSGLSLQAGEQWFARIGMGRSLDAEVVSLGGGYRFDDGNSLSMHVTRQIGQAGLGLAVRYDLSRSFLRLAYEAPLRSLGGADTLRFSAGVRF